MIQTLPPTLLSSMLIEIITCIIYTSSIIQLHNVGTRVYKVTYRRG